MHLLWKRYTRSGYAPPWFYALVALRLRRARRLGRRRSATGSCWRSPLVMIAVTIAGSRFMRRLRRRGQRDRKHGARQEG